MENMNLFNSSDKVIEENIKRFVLGYKKDMRKVNLNQSALIDILSEQNKIDKEQYFFYHELIIKNTLNKIYKIADIKEAFRILFPFYVIITSEQRGIDCSIFYEDIDIKVMVAYIRELEKVHDIALYSDTSFDVEDIKEISKLIYATNLLKGCDLGKSTPQGLKILNYCYYAYPNEIKLLDIESILNLKYTNTIDTLIEVPNTNELLDDIVDSKFKDFTILLFADILKSLEGQDREFQVFKDLVKTYGNAKKYVKLIQACFELIIKVDIDLKYTLTIDDRNEILDYNLAIDDDERNRLSKFIIKMKDSGWSI